jgi:hypothetical protein
MVSLSSFRKRREEFWTVKVDHTIECFREPNFRLPGDLIYILFELFRFMMIRCAAVDRYQSKVSRLPPAAARPTVTKTRN